ncbi:MAG: pyridoxal-phosphate dependent enzyme [Bdellovibrionota bacterium]
MSGQWLAYAEEMETLAVQNAFSANQSFPFRVDRISITENRGIFVVRDDLLPAGTKQRAVIPLLQEFLKRRISHVTYASPFAGFAQVALAYGCKEVGLRCTLYCERDPNQAGFKAHDFTELARQWGAEIFLVDSLATGEQRAADLAESGDCHKIPLGFHCSEFQSHFQRAVKEGLGEIRHQLGFLPARTWLPVGSGTLTQAFRSACPPEMELHCVDVHVLPPSDLRLQALRSLSNVQFYSVPESFPEKAIRPPPLPSNIHYDAKLWNILCELSRSGDLWWNVAR